MDGTLTPARKPMEKSTMLALRDLQWAGYEIGIVTGSDMDYLVEQCDILFDLNGFKFHKAHYLPCNGTKYYKYGESGKLETIYENDMIKTIGEKSYRQLVSTCLNIQNHIVESTNCPLTGTFFDYRGSMLNWCPIGRSASKKERKTWVKIDKDSKVRLKWCSHLKSMLNQFGIDNLTIKLGGETSFDIYPKGWDKTYCLKNFSDYSEINFVGDRCEENGNDQEIYSKVSKMKNCNAFKTNNPKMTVEIIKKFINK